MKKKTKDIQTSTIHIFTVILKFFSLFLFLLDRLSGWLRFLLSRLSFAFSIDDMQLPSWFKIEQLEFSSFP